MEKFVWTEDFSVGVPLMDEQHKKLIDLINAVADTNVPGRVFDSIMRMYSYADEHFRNEEALMRRIGYAGIDEQIRMHKSFSAKAVEFAGRDFTKGVTQQEVFTFLRNWLTEHILKLDMAYKAHVPREGSA